MHDVINNIVWDASECVQTKKIIASNVFGASNKLFSLAECKDDPWENNISNLWVVSCNFNTALFAK